jgi:hypothetical protein
MLLYILVLLKNKMCLIQGFWFIKNARIKLNFDPADECICYLRMKGKFFDTMIICVHTPNEEKDETIRNSFMIDWMGLAKRCRDMTLK